MGRPFEGEGRSQGKEVVKRRAEIMSFKSTYGWPMQSRRLQVTISACNLCPSLLFRYILVTGGLEDDFSLARQAGLCPKVINAYEDAREITGLTPAAYHISGFILVNVVS